MKPYLHCDDFYLDCFFRGDVDAFHEKKLSFCLSHGMLENKFCKHCKEFRTKKFTKRKSSPVIICDVVLIKDIK